MTQGVLEQAAARKAASTNPTQYVYFFGGGKADGNGRMKDVLGGKGAGLAEMTNAGLPVPPGFTIQTEACREYMRGKLSPQIDAEMLCRPRAARKAARTEARRGRQSAAGLRPLRRKVLHARHDGHHSQPRPQRQGRRSLSPSSAIIPALLMTPIAASSRCSATWSSTFPRRSSSTSSTASKPPPRSSSTTN